MPSSHYITGIIKDFICHKPNWFECSFFKKGDSHIEYCKKAISPKNLANIRISGRIAEQ